MNANQSPEESKEQAPPREVRFDDSPPAEITVQYPPFESDDDIWYSQSQVRGMIQVQRADILRFAQALRMRPHDIVTNEQRVDMLGLESYISPPVAQGFVHNRNAHRILILQVQNRQGSPDELRRASETHSQFTREASLQLALRMANMNI